MGLTNAYNFMDGIDGMAGGVALVAGLGWMWLSSDTETWFVFWIALAVAASSLGFLGHNWSPAKIFMGDVGSTFLGYTFAVLSLVSANQGGDALMIGTLLMWTVIMDSVRHVPRTFDQAGKCVYSAPFAFISAPGPGGVQSQHHQSILYDPDRCGGTACLSLVQGDKVAPRLIFFGLPAIWILLSIMRGVFRPLLWLRGRTSAP